MPGRTHEKESLVYSTDPATPLRERATTSPRAAEASAVRVWLEKKGRNGTPVSIVRGLPNDRDTLLATAARLKRACGTGGTAKDGEIIIQGDHRERIVTTLARDGIHAKLAGG
jgi:translation initiation factor 1